MLPKTTPPYPLKDRQKDAAVLHTTLPRANPVTLFCSVYASPALAEGHQHRHGVQFVPPRGFPGALPSHSHQYPVRFYMGGNV